MVRNNHQKMYLVFRDKGCEIGDAPYGAHDNLQDAKAELVELLALSCRWGCEQEDDGPYILEIILARTITVTRKPVFSDESQEEDRTLNGSQSNTE